MSSARITSLILFILGSLWAFILIPSTLASPNLFLLSGYLVWIGWLLRCLEVPFIVKHSRIFWIFSAIQNLFSPIVFSLIYQEGFVPLDIWWVIVGIISINLARVDREDIPETTIQTRQESDSKPQDT